MDPALVAALIAASSANANIDTPSEINGGAVVIVFRHKQLHWDEFRSWTI